MTTKTKTINKIMLGASVLAISLCAVQVPSAHANPEYSEYVERIDLAPGGGINMHVILRNTSANKHVSSVKIEPKSSTMQIPLEGHVKCEKDKDTNFSEAKAYWGPVDLFVDTITDTGALYSASYNASNTTWNGVSGGKWITESGNDQPFSVPLSSIKQGSPAVRLDPVEELNKKLATHLNQGKDKADFYKHDQFMTVNRVVSLAGWCRKTISFSQAVSKAGYRSIPVQVNIKYEGDPAVNDTPVLNAKLNGNLPNQINQNMPFKLAEATFQPNMPHYIGKCAPDQDPMIRVNYKGGGGKGKIRFSIEDNTSPVFGTQDIQYDSANGTAHLDFAYPLKAKLVANPAYNEVNKTFTHPLKVRAKVMDEKANTWGPWQDFGSAEWKHRCTPKVNVQLGGQIGGQGGKFQNNGNNPPASPQLNLKAAEQAPKPDRLRAAQ